MNAAQWIAWLVVAGALLWFAWVVAALVVQARAGDLTDLPLIENDDTYWDDDPAVWN